jgi:5-bromo-4-chloroindolyl phosphate hydrolysis protein
MRVTTIVSLIAGGALYYLLHYIFHLNLLISIPSGIAAFIFIRKAVIKLIIERNSGIASLTPVEEQAHTIAKDGLKRLKQLSSSTLKIKDNDVAAKVKEICKIGTDIFKTIKENPSDLRRARQFTNYYLDATEKIIERYIQLTTSKVRNDEIDKAVKDVEEVLDTIKGTYEKQYAALFEDDVLDLDVEIKLLKQTIKLEG